MNIADDLNEFDKIAQYFPKERKMLLNLGVIKGQFIQGTHYKVLKSIGVTKKEADKYFKTSADWVKFTHWKAGNRQLITKNAKETDSALMNRINRQTFDEVVKYKKLAKDSFETAGLSILKDIFEGPTNVGGVINSLPKTVKDKDLAKQIALDMLETAGDFGTTIKASSKGFAVNGSIAQRIMQDHKYRLIETLSEMEND